MSNLTDTQNTTAWNLTLAGPNTTNSSSEPPIPQWDAVSGLYLLLLILIVSGNGLVLYVCIKTPSLRTPFNIYVINLLITNTVWAILELPWDITTALYNYQWILSHSVCMLYIYATFLLQAAQFNCHLLICINRIWAVLAPMSYRVKNSKKVAVCSCIVVLAYVHIIQLPAIIIDAIQGAENGCAPNVDSRSAWDLISVLVMFGIPMVLMIVTVVVVWFITAARQTTAARKKRAVSNARGTELTDSKIPNAAVGATQLSVLTGVTSQKTNGDTTGRPAGTEQAASFRGLRLLTILTISTMIAWLPTDILYLLSRLDPLDDAASLRVYTILNLFYRLQAALDPLLFTLAMPKLRVALCQILRRNQLQK